MQLQVYQVKQHYQQQQLNINPSLHEMKHLKHAHLLHESYFHACFSIINAWKLLSCMLQNISCMVATFMRVSCMKHYFHAWHMTDSCMETSNMHETCMFKPLALPCIKYVYHGTMHEASHYWLETAALPIWKRSIKKALVPQVAASVS